MSFFTADDRRELVENVTISPQIAVGGVGRYDNNLKLLLKHLFRKVSHRKNSFVQMTGWKKTERYNFKVTFEKLDYRYVLNVNAIEQVFKILQYKF